MTCPPKGHLKGKPKTDQRSADMMRWDHLQGVLQDRARDRLLDNTIGGYLSLRQPANSSRE